MAFNLKKVLKALLLSTNQPLSTKDIQAAFSRFHENSLLPTEEEPKTEAAGAASETALAESPPEAPAINDPVEAVEIVAEVPADPELYSDVPSLITGTQIREVMDEIAVELRA